MAETLKENKIDLHDNMQDWVETSIMETYKDTNLSLEKIRNAIDQKNLESELKMSQVLGVMKKIENSSLSAGEVLSVQIALKGLGFDPGIIDGIYMNDKISEKTIGKNSAQKKAIYRENSSTRAAVEQFQLDRNKKNPSDKIGVDGWVGKNTLARLIIQFEKTITPAKVEKSKDKTNTENKAEKPEDKSKGEIEAKKEAVNPAIEPESKKESAKPTIKPESTLKRKEETAVADSTKVVPAYKKPEPNPVISDKKVIIPEPVEKDIVAKEVLKNSSLESMFDELVKQTLFSEDDKNNYTTLLNFAFAKKTPNEQKEFLAEIDSVLVSDDLDSSKKGQIFYKLRSFIGHSLLLEKARQGLYDLQKNPQNEDKIRADIEKSLDAAAEDK